MIGSDRYSDRYTETADQIMAHIMFFGRRAVRSEHVATTLAQASKAADCIQAAEVLKWVFVKTGVGKIERSKITDSYFIIIYPDLCSPDHFNLNMLHGKK